MSINSVSSLSPLVSQKKTAAASAGSLLDLSARAFTVSSKTSDTNAAINCFSIGNSAYELYKAKEEGKNIRVGLLNLSASALKAASATTDSSTAIDCVSIASDICEIYRAQISDFARSIAADALKRAKADLNLN